MRRDLLYSVSRLSIRTTWEQRFVPVVLPHLSFGIQLCFYSFPLSLLFYLLRTITASVILFHRSSK